MVTASSSIGKKRITLRDVIIHVQHMGQGLEKRMDVMKTDLSKDIHSLDVRLTKRIDALEENLTKRIDALDEDLTATMKDTLWIREFVGMPVPQE